MATKTIYVTVEWHGRKIFDSYYILSGKNEAEIRQKAKERAKKEHSPTPKAKISIRTRFKK